MTFQWLQAGVIFATSLSSALLALLILSARRPPRRTPRWGAEARHALEDTVFLFDDDVLVDATVPARKLLETAPIGSNDWLRLTGFLVARFPGFSDAMAQLAQKGRFTLESQAAGGSPMRLLAEDVNGLARITLVDPEAEGSGVLVDSLSQKALEDELELLRSAVDRMPVPAWRETATGEVTWANRSYVLRADALEADEGVLAWPLPRLFDGEPGEFAGHGPRRLRARPAAGAPAAAGEAGAADWFDCHAFALGEGSGPGAGRGMLCFALPAADVVRAERALRDFMQTLTKTFADLPIGLAIFDRQRQLRIFNPALSDLTTLGPEFLSGRPTLHAFLDRLREARMMPEPKDYRSWRRQMTVLEENAASGHHSEVWTLPAGQTYRVTGRPHPGGAVAFLFEDISSEISLSRRFRADLELGQEVLDSMNEAIAVFLPSGELVMSNRAYAELWGSDPGTTLGRITLREVISHWRNACQPSAFWAELADCAGQMGRRTAGSAALPVKTAGLPVNTATTAEHASPEEDMAPIMAESTAGVPRNRTPAAARLTNGDQRPARTSNGAASQGGRELILHCRYAPLPGGATLIGFRVTSTPADGPGQPGLPSQHLTMPS